MAAPPLIPLALGAGALWLLSQLGKGGAAAQGQAGCPQGTILRTLSNGQALCLTPDQAAQLANVPDNTLIDAIEKTGIGVAGGVITGVGIPLLMHFLLGSGTGTAATGAGSAAAGAGTGIATTITPNVAPAVVGAGAGTAGSDAATATSIFADEAASAVASSSELAGLGLVGAMVAIPYILAQTTSLLAQLIGGVARNRNRADASAPTNLDTILYNEQAATANFAAGLATGLNSVIQSKSQAAGKAPAYPNLNVQTQLSGLAGFAGARRLGGFGIVSAKAARGVATTSAVSKLTPDTSQPYTYAEAGYAGGHNQLGTVIAYCAGAGSYCYYLTAVDPRLPVKVISNFRGFMRWMFWTQERAYNATMEQYWQNRLIAENGIPECPGLDATACLAKFVIPSTQFDAQTAAYFQSQDPAQLLPSTSQTFTTYPELNALALQYIQALNAAVATRPDLQIDFTKLTQSNNFSGIAQAICAAAQIGFGSWSSTWPGDFEFTQMILRACGLDAAGWTGPTSIFVQNSNYGNAHRWLIQDPVTGWFIDVVGSRDAKTPMCYKFIPQGANLNTNPALPAMPNPVPSYVPLAGYSRGRGRSRRPVQRMAMGCVVPLDPPKMSWFGEMIAKGLRQ